MKLLLENNFTTTSPVIEESVGGKPRSYFLEGIFMESEITNLNGRRYLRHVLEEQVEEYNKNYIKTRRSTGELTHPANKSPEINPKNVSHYITELRMDGNNVVGRAKILTEHPSGHIVKCFMDEGLVLGVSSRGLGEMSEDARGTKIVQKYILKAIDIVTDPSSPNAYVDAVMENKEWVYVGGVLVPQVIEEHKKIISKTRAKDLEKKAIVLFRDFLSKLP